MAGLLVALWPQAARACGAPPPPVDCSAQLTCVLGSPQVLFQTESGPLGNPSVTSVVVPTRVHHSLHSANTSAPCSNPVQLIEVSVEADCEEMIIEGSNANPFFQGAALAAGLNPGTQVVDVGLDIDIPGEEREDRGHCALSGTARLLQTDGLEIEAPCGPTFLSFARPTLTGTGPIVGGQFIDDGDKSEVGSGHYTAAPYAPQLIEVLVTNNHETETFSGSLELVSNNENSQAEVLASPPVIGSNVELTHSLSSGEGDDFVLQFASNVPEGGCFDLPEPQNSISPTAESGIELGPGESMVLEIYGRSWPNCADGSCSGITYNLAGFFGDGEPFQAYLGGSLQVEEFDFALENPNICPDGGNTTEIGKCEEGDYNCFEKREGERRAGLVFESAGLKINPAVMSTTTDISVATIQKDIEEQANGDSSGRIWETLWIPRGELSEGQEVTVASHFDIALVGEFGDYEITEVVVGGKYQPASEEEGADPTSFIGVGRIEVSTSPYTEISTQYQAGAWTVDADSQELKRLVITEYNLTTTDDGVVAEFTFIGPDYEVDKVHISHDLRGYVWTAFEDVCDDIADNDNDGL
ncbi:MAG: hypothetical protein VX498_08135, partial [Myxococcota bacterium]|nr:hypothetical protein [Myxococcota bacterium]